MIAELNRWADGKIAQTDMLDHSYGFEIMNIRREIGVRRSKESVQ